MDWLVMSLPFASCGCVTTIGVQPGKLPRTKLFSVALVEVDERLSASVLAKHSLLSPKALRSRPPSYNSPWAKLVLPALSVNGHGAVVPFAGLTMPQKAPAKAVGSAQ